MSTEQSHAKKPPNEAGEEDDLSALIYRESQLRKAEAAAESKKKSLLRQLCDKQKQDTPTR